MSRRLRAWAPVAVLILLCLVFSLINSNFLNPWNLVRLLNAAAIPTILAMGMTFIILMGSIDLSVEGVVAITAVLASLLVANQFNSNDFGVLIALPAAMLLGGLVGLLSGTLHVKLRTPSFMTTLGIGFACVGVATAVLGGFTVRITDQTFRALALSTILRYSRRCMDSCYRGIRRLYHPGTHPGLGRWVYALGGDEEIAQQSGVPVARTRILVFMVAGIFFALGGVLAAAQLGQGHALISQGRLFVTITAVVVGGTALTGGVRISA